MCLGPAIAGTMVHPRKADGLGGWCTERYVMGDKAGKVVRGQVQAGPCRPFRDLGFCFKGNWKSLKSFSVCFHFNFCN